MDESSVTQKRCKVKEQEQVRFRQEEALLFRGRGKNLEDLWNILEAKLDNLHGKMEDPENEKINVYIFAGIWWWNRKRNCHRYSVYHVRKIIENETIGKQR
ncbi:MAG: hypothetical protein V8S38_02720 [Lachnospiraceae bacterium]